MMKTTPAKKLICLLCAAMLYSAGGYAVEGARRYDVHDKSRENPPVMTPPERFGQPPADAIVLFDGTDESVSQWERDRRAGGRIAWNVVKGENGYMEVVKKAGGIRTKKLFGNCQLHIEWWTPEGIDPKITDQKRSNSGVFLMDRYEVQILDSFTRDNYKDNKTYADGQAAAIYGQHPPMLNVCREPGQWQTYDISFLRPIIDKDGNVLRKGRITVIHNGVVVHNNLEIEGTTSHKRKAKYSPHNPPDKGHIRLQDHGNPIRFRNIWIRELPEEPYLIK
jgi:hypothetical protein